VVSHDFGFDAMFRPTPAHRGRMLRLLQVSPSWLREAGTSHSAVEAFRAGVTLDERVERVWRGRQCFTCRYQ
jgi:hypothetical protein